MSIARTGLLPTEEPFAGETNASSGPFTLDLGGAKYYAFLMNANLVISAFSGVHDGRIDYCVVKVRGDGSARTITWPAAVKWAAGAAPTPSSGAGVEDVFTFVFWGSASRVLGFSSGQGHPA